MLTDAVTIALLVVAAFAIGVAETFRDTSAPSLLPRLVPERLLERANGRLVGSEVVGNEFLGPLLGSTLFATAMVLPLAGDGLALALAVAFVLSLPRSARAPVTGATRARRGSIRSDLVTGIGWLSRHRLLRTVVTAGTLLAFADSAWWTVLVLYVTTVLHLPAAAYGLLLAAGAAGGAVGALLAERMAARWRTVPLLACSTLAASLPAAGLAVAPPPWVVFPLLAVSSGGFAVWNVVALSARQRRAPARLLGRVTSANRVLLYGGATAGAVLGGWLAAAVSLRAPFVAGAGVGGLGVVLLLTVNGAERR